ncbi:beta-N-acetylhexosaminidase [Prevotella copri]|uniref:family 20 glycosylhydrolase n=1 Tax=Segatella copri TaxID=165179 RepID=UPI001C38DB4B|nr:family 20 glycosylhydrolase [Segatella copri]MBV3429741.1 beta-N-acetylhexosaminidase [Segatella copri]
MNRLLLFVFSIFLCMAGISANHPSSLLPLPQKYQFNGKKSSGELTVEEKYVSQIEGAKFQEEAYHLSITRKGILLEATTPKGMYWGRQTLEQLKYTKNKKTWVPQCDITDWPAFRIRGFMHDVGRSYIPVEELKREISLLSRYKINVFHWHLTENQAWRLECKKYPQLNAPENMEREKGKFYTLDEARQLVEFCKQHQVLLIPEIDMPGHSAAFERTFNTDMQSEKGTQILKDIIDEVCETFDVPYLHIGTDEVQFTNPDFVPMMVKYIRDKGKKVISYNPGWNYKPGEIDMTQLWSYRGKAQKGIPAIDCRYHYANHFDTYADLVAMFNSRIYNQPEGSDDLAGCIVAFWNDRFIDNTPQLLAENNFYPYMLTLAERAWRGGGNCYFDGKGTLLWEDEPEQLAAFREFEHRLLWQKKTWLKEVPFPYVFQTQSEWQITDAFPNGGDLNKVFPPEQQEDSVYQYEGKTYKTRKIIGNGIYLRHVWGTLVPGFYANPQENHTAYATRWIYSPKERKAKLALEFQNYSRSESDLAPRQGTWDYKCSRAWINGQEIMPPVWQNTNTERSNEITLKNENYMSRPAIDITLKKGWNKLMLKLPVGKFSSKETRLVKWMFTAAILDE